MAENAIKTALPGKEGEMLSKMTEEVIVGGSKALGNGVASIKTTKVEVKITPKETAAIAPATEKTSSVVEEVKTPHEALTDAHVTALAGMDSYVIRILNKKFVR